MAETPGVYLFIAQAVKNTNQFQFEHLVSKVRELFGDLRTAKIFAVGLTFTANNSDLRESPAPAIQTRLSQEGAHIAACDQRADGEFQRLYADIRRVDDPHIIGKSADGFLILTEWSDFQILDWTRMGKICRKKNFVDARNILNGWSGWDLSIGDLM